MKKAKLLFVPLVEKTSRERQKEGIKLIKYLPRLTAVLPQSGKNAMKSPSFGTTCHFPHTGGRATGSTHYLTQGREMFKGFTLIELLVVVLIIGILAAVALPQYQLAITKSRLAALIPVLTAIKNASELYYLQNGEYSDSPHKLDINVCNISTQNSVFKCGGYFYIDLIATGNVVYNKITAYYCPRNMDNRIQCTAKADFVYTLWLNHSTYPNRITCTPNTALGQKICNTL